MYDKLIHMYIDCVLPSTPSLLVKLQLRDHDLRGVDADGYRLTVGLAPSFSAPVSASASASAPDSALADRRGHGIWDMGRLTWIKGQSTMLMGFRI